MELVVKLCSYYTTKLVPLGVNDRWMNIASVLAAATDDVQQEAAARVTSLLSGYVQRTFKVRIPNPAAAYPSLANFFNQCTITLDDVNLDASGKEGLIKALTQVDAEIEGRDIVRVYGRAAATKVKPFISEKFESDHLSNSLMAEKTTAQGRLYRAVPTPASTAINKGSYLDVLNNHVEALNDAGVFNAVTHYMKTTFDWNPEAQTVDSVIYLTPMKIMSRTYTRKPSAVASKGLNSTQNEGHLAFSVQEDSSVSGRYLLYHYHDIVATGNVDTPGNFKAPQRGGWAALGVDDVVETLEELNSGGKKRVTAEQLNAIRAAYYRVYYAKV